MTPYTITTIAQRSDLVDELEAVNSAALLEFMKNDPIANDLYGHLYDTFGEYQSVFLDENGKVIAGGNAIPVTWDGTLEGLPDRGWDEMLELGVANHKKGIAPNTLSAILAVVSKDHLGSGLSKEVLRAMRTRAAEHGLKALIAPVRPTMKHLYPLTPMEHYIRWTNDEGLMFDPWLRTHQRLGAQLMRVCPLAMTIPGTIEQWEEWTKMRFPETGSYVVPGALNPVEMDCEADVGRYIEPNVWMKHSL